jgi:hypothetical protein
VNVSVVGVGFDVDEVSSAMNLIAFVEDTTNDAYEIGGS